MGIRPVAGCSDLRAERGHALAVDGARAAGAAEIQVQEERDEEQAVTALGGDALYLGTRFRFIAAGRPDLKGTTGS